MNAYVVTDIFGITTALQAFVSTLNKQLLNSKSSISIIDPYEGKDLNFENEAQAYTYFMKHVGVEKYASHLYSAFTSPAHIEQIPSTVIAFSVGASAMWAISDKANININHAICFYGSQIRHLLNIHPNIKTTAILPIIEKHFDIDELQNTLEMYSNVSIKCSEYKHGFMNKCSVNFNAQAYNTYIDWLCEHL